MPAFDAVDFRAPLARDRPEQHKLVGRIMRDVELLPTG
jgi:hypothetical protein